MKRLITESIVTRENLFAGAFLFLFALILLVSDPEWLAWAGPILLGAFPAAAPAVSFAAAPLETLQAACYLILPALLAGMILAGIREKVLVFRRARSSEPSAEEMRGAAHGTPEHRKAA